MSQVYNNITDLIGNTPIIKLNNIYPDSPHEFYVKLEYLNPGGSVKDRIALAIIESAEQKGLLKQNGTIVEATSGNTGLGLAMIAIAKGYKCIFVMPDKISEEKRAILRAYGAKVVITPTAVDHDDPRSYISVSKQIHNETPNSFYVNQYHNPDNPMQHFKITGPEIWNQMNGSFDYFIAGAGTGGTISGVGKYLKSVSKNIKIILADPEGSILHDWVYHRKTINPPKPYLVEGVGEDMIPENVHFEYIDEAVVVSDKEAFQTTRNLLTSEALLVGPSSGMALNAAYKFSKKVAKSSKFLIMLPDGGRAYLSKTFNDNWLKENGLI